MRRGKAPGRLSGAQAAGNAVGVETEAWQARARAEDRYLRMWRLRRMDAGQLRRLFSGSPSEAAPWIESAAEYGLPEAQVRLAQMCLDGAGVPRNEAAALGWFLRASSKGAPEAMNMVGRCFENGWGTSVDLSAAASWYCRSADAGHDWGEYNYANMVFDGRGVDQDLALAVRFYRRAAEQGHSRAMNLLARCYEEGWGVGRNPDRSFDLYRRSAEAGYFRAQYNLATLLIMGAQSDDALTWFERACLASPRESLPSLARPLLSHPDSRVAALGRRFCGDLQGLE